MAKPLQARPMPQQFNLGVLAGFEVGKVRSTDGALGVKVKIKGLAGSPDFNTYITIQPEWCPNTFNCNTLEKRDKYEYQRNLGSVDRPGLLMGVAGSFERADDYLAALGEMAEYTPEELVAVLRSVFAQGEEDETKRPLPFLYITAQQRKNERDGDGEWIKVRGQYREIANFTFIPFGDEAKMTKTFESFLKRAEKQATRFAAGEINSYDKLDEDDAEVTFTPDRVGEVL
jgi:hypothetical protein